MAFSLKLLGPFNIIKNFTVKNNGRRPRGVVHRLVAPTEINDAETSVSQSDAIRRINPSIIWAAMTEHRDHRSKPIGIDRSSIHLEYAADSTHNEKSPKAPRTATHLPKVLIGRSQGLYEI